MRRWDDYDVYLFDIDGTLLNCTDAVHYFAFCDSLTRIAGRPLNLDGVVAHGNTDVGILRDAFCVNEVQESAWRSSLPEIRNEIGRFVADRRGELCASPLGGVTEVLDYLQSLGAILGIASGNLETVGWIKLEHCGLRRYFAFGGFSDDFEYRKDVFSGAVALARRHSNPGASICVVGDTPADVQAARSNGVDVIAVATGIFTIDQLQAEAPTFCVESLRDLQPRSAL